MRSRSAGGAPDAGRGRSSAGRRRDGGGREPARGRRVQGDMSRPRIAGFIAAVAGVCIALAGCSSSSPGGYRQGPILGDVYYRSSDHTLHVLSCGAEFRMTQSAKQVTIVSASRVHPRGTGSCRVFDFTLRLSAPLGGRRVVDGSTDKAVPVKDWGRNRPTAAETPAPSLSTRSWPRPRRDTVAPWLTSA